MLKYRDEGCKPHIIRHKLSPLTQRHKHPHTHTHPPTHAQPDKHRIRHLCKRRHTHTYTSTPLQKRTHLHPPTNTHHTPAPPPIPVNTYTSPAHRLHLPRTSPNTDKYVSTHTPDLAPLQTGYARVHVRVRAVQGLYGRGSWPWCTWPSSPRYLSGLGWAEGSCGC